MVRVLRYPRLSAAACAGAIACALGRDVCVQRGLHGWAGALLAATLLLLLARTLPWCSRLTRGSSGGWPPRSA